MPLTDAAYRYRWWLSALAMTLAVLVVPDHRPMHSVAGVVVALLWALLWIAVGIRWVRALTAARAEFVRASHGEAPLS